MVQGVLPNVIIMAKNKFSTEIREAPNNSKYLKVFFLDDSEAKNTQEILLALNEVKTVNITNSESKSHSGDTLTVYPKPMIDIDILDNVVKKTLDSHFSGVTEVKTEIISAVEFKNIEKKILDALDDAIATIDVSVAWFTNETLQKKLLEKKNEGCKVRVMTDANHTNQKHGVDLTPFEYKSIKAERNGIMHHKFCVIDNNITIHGSYNWTTASETKNNEEISVDKNDVKKASAYTKEFNRLWDNVL